VIFYLWTLSNFPSFQHQSEFFYIIGNTKQKATNVPSTSKVKEQSRECMKWKSDLSQIVSRLLLLPATISWSFIIHFEQFQRLQMHYLKIYKTCWKWKIKKTIVEELKLQNHTKHFWKNPKHNPLHFERAYLVRFPLNCNVFYIFGYARWRITKLL
jgi:hypothetical protein